MPYLNVDEVESALSAAAAAPFSDFVQLITLPHLTWEGRTCHAVRIGTNEQEDRPGLYLLGGVHANEWGSSDILVHFIEQIEQAYVNETGITIGPLTFAPSDIRTIVDTLEILVFPQVNPDGRNFSMKHDAEWRKNRRTQPPNSPSTPGVDINRNFDFLWDFPLHFNADVYVDSSTIPSQPTYRGPSPFSEPESQNVKWILDNFQSIEFFVDLHNYGEAILHSWGDDEGQTTNPQMSFLNQQFDGARGIEGDDNYKEFIAANDLSSSRNLANRVRDAIRTVGGRDYDIYSAFRFAPTSGTSDDYCYSRHIVDNNGKKIISQVIEWGRDPWPTYRQMKKIIKEVTAGLLTLCLRMSTS